MRWVAGVAVFIPPRPTHNEALELFVAKSVGHQQARIVLVIFLEVRHGGPFRNGAPALDPAACH